MIFSEYQKATARYHKERRMEMNTQRALQEIKIREKFENYNKVISSLKSMKY